MRDLELFGNSEWLPGQLNMTQLILRGIQATILYA